ncbi:receptor-like protein 52 [Carya illinoinensis]|uniref:receptor-like protein 52 n=1 Tax=Carya illinoinensis TaxID=32201 RepID=UPI001C721708|nr:receptor-like protein 52 [Carya illinoinensis]
MTKPAPIFIHFSLHITFILFLNHANSQLDYNINGTVPLFICNLKNLTTFGVHNTSFHSTEFLRALYNCSKLKILDLSQNYFYGAIPNDIHRMSRLRDLNLGVIESFLPEIGNLSNLEELGLAYNSKIVPPLPSEFGKLKKLKFLWMVGTNLIREIPNTIGEMAVLEHLDLSENSLTGKILGKLPEILAWSLTRLEMNNNMFLGKIPWRVSSSKILLVLMASNNLFNGTIPRDFSRLTILLVDRNQVSGSLPSDINS